MTTSANSKRLHQIFVANIVLGLVVFMTAVYFMITGEYANLAMREETETFLNVLSVGGLIYSVMAWYLDLYFNPQFPATES